MRSTDDGFNSEINQKSGFLLMYWTPSIEMNTKKMKCTFFEMFWFRISLLWLFKGQASLIQQIRAQLLKTGHPIKQREGHHLKNNAVVHVPLAPDFIGSTKDCPGMDLGGGCNGVRTPSVSKKGLFGGATPWHPLSLWTYSSLFMI